MSDQVHDVMSAAYSNDVQKLRALIESGASPNLVHPVGGNSLLQAACAGNALDAMRYLLESGAEPDQHITQISRVSGHTICKDATALMYVQSIEAAKLLIEFGADPHIVDGDGKSPKDWAKSRDLAELEEFFANFKNL